MPDAIISGYEDDIDDMRPPVFGGHHHAFVTPVLFIPRNEHAGKTSSPNIFGDGGNLDGIEMKSSAKHLRETIQYIMCITDKLPKFAVGQ